MALRVSSSSEARPNDRADHAYDPPLGIKCAALAQFLVMIMLFLYVPPGRPIRSGTDYQEKAKAFLKESYPDRPVSPDGRPATVAVVFELVRSGDNISARHAIDFATENHFGNASPYVIKRLESEDPQLRHSARSFLVRIAGEDYGSSAEPWRAWWRNPPRRVFGIGRVGQRTLEYSMPAVVLIVGLLLWGVVHSWYLFKGRRVSWIFALIFLGCPVFAAVCVVLTRTFATFETCTFGSENVSYYMSSGIVLGLEDSRYDTRWFLFTTLFLVVIGAVILFSKAQKRREQARVGQG
jgi:hypothetical protein